MKGFKLEPGDWEIKQLREALQLKLGGIYE